MIRIINIIRTPYKNTFFYWIPILKPAGYELGGLVGMVMRALFVSPLGESIGILFTSALVI